MKDQPIPHPRETSPADAKAAVKAFVRWFYNKDENRELKAGTDKFRHQLEVFVYLYPTLLRARRRIARLKMKRKARPKRAPRYPQFGEPGRRQQRGRDYVSRSNDD